MIEVFIRFLLAPSYLKTKRAQFTFRDDADKGLGFRKQRSVKLPYPLTDDISAHLVN